jgi:hypothetical protein
MCRAKGQEPRARDLILCRLFLDFATLHRLCYASSWVSVSYAKPRLETSLPMKTEPTDLLENHQTRQLGVEPS